MSPLVHLTPPDRDQAPSNTYSGAQSGQNDDLDISMGNAMVLGIRLDSFSTHLTKKTVREDPSSKQVIC